MDIKTFLKIVEKHNLLPADKKKELFDLAPFMMAWERQEAADALIVAHKKIQKIEEEKNNYYVKVYEEIQTVQREEIPKAMKAYEKIDREQELAEAERLIDEE